MRRKGRSSGKGWGKLYRKKYGNGKKGNGGKIKEVLEGIEKKRNNDEERKKEMVGCRIRKKSEEGVQKMEKKKGRWRRV